MPSDRQYDAELERDIAERDSHGFSFEGDEVSYLLGALAAAREALAELKDAAEIAHDTHAACEYHADLTTAVCLCPLAKKVRVAGAVLGKRG